MKSYRFFYNILGAAAVLVPYHAYAEAVDYESLQSLFGEPVTTSATGTPQRASNVAANMTIVTADEIRQSGSRSIPEILSRVPGLNILQTGYAGLDVGVRGYQQPSMPRLLVLVDGRQVFVDDYSRTIWNNIPVNVDDIRQIEVVKGPASALFGSNAAGGVINIVTYSPQFDHNNVISAYAGSQRTFGTEGTATQRSNWGSTKTSLGGYNANDFNTPMVDTVDDTRPVTPYKRYITNSSVFQLDSKFQINTEATYSFSRENYAIAPFFDSGDRDTTYSLRAGFQWQTPYGLIINDNYYNHSYDNLYLATGALPLTTGLEVNRLEDTFKMGSNNTFRLGLEYRNKKYENGGHGNVYPENPALEENNYALSGTWLHQFTNKLSWVNALRFDHLDMTETGTLPQGSYYNYADYGHVINTVSGNSGLVYQATDNDTFRLSYGRGVQDPSMIETSLGSDQFNPLLGLPVELTGNPKLKPTIVQNYELDYDRTLADIDSVAKFSVFYQNNQDLKSFFQATNPIPFNGGLAVLYSVENVGGSQGWGGEVELKGAKDGFRWDASYSLARVDDGTLAVQSLDYTGSAPEHQFRLFGGYTWHQWEFDGNGQYVTSTASLRSFPLSTNIVKESGYYSFGGRIGYNITDQYTVALSGTNINRQYIQENPYMAVERAALLTLTGKF